MMYLVALSKKDLETIAKLVEYSSKYFDEHRGSIEKDSDRTAEFINHVNDLSILTNKLSKAKKESK